MNQLIKCDYLENCQYSCSKQCEGCKNNHYRNYRTNFFEPANDLVIHGPNSQIRTVPPTLQMDNDHKSYLLCPVCKNRNYMINRFQGQYICSDCGVIFNLSKQMIELGEIKEEDLERRWIKKMNHDDTIENKDNITEAVHGLDIFTKNWCINCEETNKSDDLVFRCDECPFLSGEKCIIKQFAHSRKHDYPMNLFGSMIR